MTRQDQAKAKRARRAARGPGFSHYAKGLPKGRELRAQRSMERAAVRKKAEKEVEKVAKPPADVQA